MSKPRKPTPDHVKAAADRAEARSAGDGKPKRKRGRPRKDKGALVPTLEAVKRPDGTFEAGHTDPRFETEGDEELHAEDRKPRGRPSKYDPSMCQTAIDCGYRGFSKAQTARALGIDRGTMREWAAQFPDFSLALKTAYDLALAYWEDMQEPGCYRGQKWNATQYIFTTKNRFREDYSDASEIKHGADNAFLQMLVYVSTGKLPEAEKAPA